MDCEEMAGKAQMAVSKEMPGLNATGRKEAMWREVVNMVDNEEATPEQIDFAIVNGPGPRWAMMGPCLTYHIGGGEGGMAYCLDQFGPALKLPWTRLKAPELADKLRNRLIDGAARVAGGRDYTALNRERDLGLVAISKALQAIKDSLADEENG